MDVLQGGLLGDPGGDSDVLSRLVDCRKGGFMLPLADAALCR